jgi:hypothetical protein
MSSKHTLLVAAICALPLSLAACGSSSGNETEGNVTPQGTHYGYVVSKATVPATAGQDTTFGLDLGTKTSSKPDGIADNAIGSVFIALTALKFDLEGTITTAVDHGNILLLLDFQTTDFSNAGAAGLEVKLGTNAMPAACTDANDMTCRHHLDGTAKFDIAADSPGDALVAGKIAGGKFTGGPGNLSLQIAIGSTTPIKLDLIHARATATSISATGMTAVLGGLVTKTELTAQVGPPLLTSVQAVYDRDCPQPRTAPSCNCKSGSTGSQIEAVVDFNPKDCVLTTDELFTNPIVGPMLVPDGCSMDTCAAGDALGIGIQVEAVKATFPM